VDVLFKQGRLSLNAISRQARIPEKTVSETLIVLIQHGFVRWVTPEDELVERTLYECSFEDIYPLIRYGKEIQLAEKHAGPEVIPYFHNVLMKKAGSLVQYLLMQGGQKIKDITTALTDSNDIDYQSRLKTLQKTLITLVNQQYFRTVHWWNLIPQDELNHKLQLEEETKLRESGQTTSVSMTSKIIKEAGKATEHRLKAMMYEDRTLDGLKRKVSEMIDIDSHRNKRRRLIVEDDDDEEEDVVRFDFDVISFYVVTDFRKMLQLLWIIRNSLFLYGTWNWYLKFGDVLVLQLRKFIKLFSI